MYEVHEAGRAAAERRGRRPRAAAAAAMAFSVLLLALLAAQTAAASGKKPAEFSRGIQAQDKGDWAASEKLMREALGKEPEDAQAVRIYGTRYENYLPHYYLGLALYKQGKCAAALQEWETCLRIGAVQRKPELGALAEHRAECQKRLLYQPPP